MPLYDYECRACHHVFEALVRSTDPAPTACPACKAEDLERLPAWLNQTVAGTQSTIHGDLNLENALVGPGGIVWLIDFALKF